MRTIISMILLLSILMVTQACNTETETSKKISNAAMERLNTMDKAKEIAQRTELVGLRQSISTFYATEGRYPKDLSELEKFASVTIDKGIYKYDPGNGTITVMQ